MTRWLPTLMLVGCAVDVSGIPGTDGDVPSVDMQVPVDAPVVEDEDGFVEPIDMQVGCSPEGALHCADGEVMRCVSGELVSERVCAPLACAADEARCDRVDVSHLSNDDLLLQGTVDLSTAGDVLIDTDDGEIRIDGSELRGPGIGTIAGIPFATEDQPAPGADLGVVVLRNLELLPGSTLTTRGRRALVLLVSQSVIVQGTIDVGANGRTAGPGGGTGGGRREDGGHPGGGERGDLDGILGGQQGGGGGGGHAAAGGMGGTDDGGIGGDGGVIIPDPEGEPLCGGGGGGGGADVDDGGPGGGGGGAIQITAGGSIVVRSAGIIRAPGAGGSRSGEGAGGGGAGGTIYLEAPTLTMNGILAANGGGGGGAGDGSTNGTRGQDVADRTPGGDEGPGNGNGGFGGGGGGLEGLAGGDGDPGGGGGGAAGRVVLRAASGALTVTGLISVEGAARTLGELRTL
ncbi:MAG: hypothetical protein JJ863_16670 [Deltaproteobacteria bacterium]|nr:hypothetical protein [Deltaproteobacteria bacterium]